MATILISMIVAIGCGYFLFVYETFALKFSRDPDPTRVTTVKILDAIAFFVVLGLYGAIGLFALQLFEQVFDTSQRLNDAVLKSIFGVIIVMLLIVVSFLRRKIRYLAIESQGSGSAPRTIGSNDPSHVNDGARLSHFTAMEYFALILNRTFEVFVADAMLCGAKVGGIVASPPTPQSDQQNPEYWVNTLSGSLYSRLDVTTPAFLKLNGANFQIRWNDVSRIEFNPGKKWGMGNVPHSGRIFVFLKSGQFRELILLGQQDGNAIKRELDKAIGLNVAAI